jgi:hypothetical protein
MVMKGQYVVWYPKGLKIRPKIFKLLWKGPYVVRRLLKNNTVLLRSLDEEEFLLVNAHKLEPYFVRKSDMGKSQQFQEH